MSYRKSGEIRRVVQVLSLHRISVGMPGYKATIKAKRKRIDWIPPSLVLLVFQNRSCLMRTLYTLNVNARTFLTIQLEGRACSRIVTCHQNREVSRTSPSLLCTHPSPIP